VLAFTLTLLLFLVTSAAPGCKKKAEMGKGETGETSPTGDGRDAGAGGGGETAPGEGEVKTADVLLYFGVERNGKLYLKAERRSISYRDDLYLAVLRELVKGPSPGSGLRPVLPPTTRVLGTRLESGVLTVNLSKEVIIDAPSLATGAEGEVLALAALADTMTELPGVVKVKLLVEGKDRGMVDGRAVEDFWGHVGLPEQLERNEALILK